MCTARLGDIWMKIRIRNEQQTQGKEKKNNLNEIK
jgi:hypothetical protein